MSTVLVTSSDCVNISGLYFIRLNFSLPGSPLLLLDIVRNERLTTVEEVSEPLSSDFVLDSLPNDANDNPARFGSSGTASSDFQADSLPPDFNNGESARDFALSL